MENCRKTNGSGQCQGEIRLTLELQNLPSHVPSGERIEFGDWREERFRGPRRTAQPQLPNFHGRLLYESITSQFV